MAPWNGTACRGERLEIPLSMNAFSTQEAGEIGDARALGMGGKGHRMTPETRKAGKLVRLSGDAEARCARRSEMPSPVAISCGPLPVWATADRNPPMRGACACWRLCRSRPVRRVSIEASTEGTSWSTQRSMQPGSNTKTGGGGTVAEETSRHLRFTGTSKGRVCLGDGSGAPPGGRRCRPIL